MRLLACTALLPAAANLLAVNGSKFRKAASAVNNYVEKDRFASRRCLAGSHVCSTAFRNELSVTQGLGYSLRTRTGGSA